MATARYRELARRLAKLRKHLLPATFSSIGNYTEKQLDKARGYRLLVHAEIESYLEDRARFIINECVRNWGVDQKPKGVLISLLSFHLEQESPSAQDLRDELVGTKTRSRSSMKTAAQAFNAMLSKNNGIRESNILKMLFPLGVRPSEIDQTWLNTIDSFGADRGETAHTSLRAHQPLDPQNEFNKAEALLAGLAKIDKTLSKIKI